LLPTLDPGVRLRLRVGGRAGPRGGTPHSVGRRPPYPVVCRLISSAAGYWEAFDGWCASEGGGFQPFDLPLSRLCNVIYWFITKDRTQEDIDKIKAQLSEPIPGRRMSATTEEALIEDEMA